MVGARIRNHSSMSLEGKKAPNFSLPDQNGVVHTLADYAGKWVLLYFYPKDMTPGCTIEAHTFEQMMPEFERRGVRVFGVSKLGVASKKKFCEKEGLHFSLLADEKQEVVKRYGVLKEKNLYGKKVVGIVRESFLIDPSGVVARHYQNVKPVEHPARSE